LLLAAAANTGNASCLAMIRRLSPRPGATDPMGLADSKIAKCQCKLIRKRAS
jgi:hypothetical protein